MLRYLIFKATLLTVPYAVLFLLWKKLSLPVGKAVVPDVISNRLLRELSREISPALCGFFNQSLRTCTVPDSFMQFYVSPLH